MVGLDLFFGPIVGAIGGIVSQWAAYKSKQLDLNDRIDQRKHDIQKLEMESRLATQAAAQAAANLANQTALEMEGRLNQEFLKGANAVNAQVANNIGDIMSNMPNVDPVMPEDSTGLRWFKNILGALQTMVRVVITVYLCYKFSVLSDVVISKLQSSEVVLSAETVKNIYEAVVYGFLELTMTVITFWVGGRGTALKIQAFGRKGDSKSYFE